LSRIRDRDLDEPSVLAAYHDALLFLLAYPDNEEIHRTALRELERTARIARRLNDSGRHEQLTETGIAYSETTGTYSRDIARWLNERWGRHVSIHWMEDSAGPGLDETMPLLLDPVERDELLMDQTTRSVIRQAGGKSNELGWILDRLERLSDDPVLLDHVWDRIKLRLNWVLNSPKVSTTFARFPTRRVHYFIGGLERHWSIDDYPSPHPARPLPTQNAQQIIDTCRTTLAVRGRETDPVTVANPAETYLYRLDRGLDVAVIGMLPGRRLPIESYFGFVAARNRIPIAYGGGWVFFDRCEIGINVFDTFRGGESIHTLARVIDVYRGLFRPQLLTVAPNQIGDGNEEAIASGAYWAYDRLGFRSTDPLLATLADRERARRERSSEYRSPPSVLRRLARSRLVLRLAEMAPTDPLEVDVLAHVSTKWIAERHSGNLDKARRAAINRVIAALGVNDLELWPTRQRKAFEHLSLLISPIRDLASWPDRDKKSLVLLMRAKGEQQERRFALRLQRHRRLYDAWTDLARS
jgi:hypothetical protein